MIKRKDILSITLLAVITIIFFWQILAEPKELMASGDLLSDSVFSANFMHQTFQEYGERALWNPYFLTGKTHVGHFLYSQYYLTGLTYLFYYKEPILNFILIIHFLLAGIFMYLFLRSIGLRSSSATIGAITFILGRNFLILFWGDTIQIISYAYIPLVFLGVEKVLQKQNALWAILSGLFLSIQFLGGHTQYFYYTCLALVVYIVLRLFNKTPHKLKSLGYLLLAALVFLGVTSIQLIPAIELATYTIQTSESNPVTTFEFSSQESVPPKQLLTLFVPDIFGSRIDNSYWGPPSRMIDLYIGLIPLILALLAIASSKNRYKRIFLMLAVLSILFSLGRYTPFYYALYKTIPGMGLFKVPARMLTIFTFSMACLAALGLEQFLSLNKGNIKNITKLLGAATLFSVLATICIYTSKQAILSYGRKLLEHYYTIKYANTQLVHMFSLDYFINKIPVAFNYLSSGLVKSSILLLAMLAITYILYKTNKKNLVRKLVVLIVIADLLILTNVYDWDKIKEISYPETGNSSADLKQWDELANELNKEGEYFRVVGFPQSVIVQNNLYSLHGSDSMPVHYSSKYSNYIIDNMNKQNVSTMLGLANVKYLLTQETLSDTHYELIKGNLIYSDSRFGANRTFRLYKNLNWMPRAFIVPNYKTAELEKQFDIIKNLAFNPEEEVLITEDAGREGGQRYKEANITYYSPNKVKLSIVTEKPGFFVMSDTYYPGWKAYDNGQETKIYHANYIMRALYLPAGEHNVEFAYDPMSYKIGKWITFATLSAVAGTLLILLSRRRINPGA